MAGSFGVWLILWGPSSVQIQALLNGGNLGFFCSANSACLACTHRRGEKSPNRRNSVGGEAGAIARSSSLRYAGCFVQPALFSWIASLLIVKSWREKEGKRVRERCCAAIVAELSFPWRQTGEFVRSKSPIKPGSWTKKTFAFKQNPNSLDETDFGLFCFALARTFFFLFF